MILRDQNDLIIEKSYSVLRSQDNLQVDLSTGQVVIISPTDGQTDFVEGSLYEWGFSGDEEWFRVEVATDDQFSNIVQNSDVQAKQLASTVAVATGYYIRVTALEPVTPSTPNEVTGISISSGSTIDQNGSRQFTVTVSGTGSFNEGYTASGTGLSFSISGNILTVTDVSGTDGQEKTFTVASVADNSITASRTLTVQSSFQAQNSKEGDEAALQEFVSTTDISLSGWSETMTLEDTIDGVTVDDRGGVLRVTEINIIGNGITGTIPESWANFQEAEKLHFKRNNLSGPLPSKLGIGGKLIELSISGKTDEIFDLTYNNIQSNIKDGPLDNNSFDQGDLPETIYNNTGLKYFEVDGTDIGSTMSPLIGNLVNLELLYASARQWDDPSQGFTFIGEIAHELENCTKIKWLHLSSNNLSGDVSTILNNYTQLIDLKFDRNPNLSGSVPNPQNSRSTFRALGIGGTDIGKDEPYPVHFNSPDWTRLLTFKLQETEFTGSPEYNLMQECNNYEIVLSPASGELFKGIDLSTGLDGLFNNQSILFQIRLCPNLTGEFPHGDWGKWSNVRFVYVSECDAFGTLPPICLGTSNTSVNGFMGLVLFDNRLSGSIPASYGQLGVGNNPRAYFIPTTDTADSAWAIGVDYSPPTVVSFDGSNYKVINYHTSQAGDEPPNTLDDGSARPFRDFRVNMNDLSGVIPEELKNINFKYIPNGPFKTGATNVSRNRFTFADICPHIDAILGRYEPINAKYIYSPQKAFGDSGDLSAGVIDLSAYHYTGNVYEWRKDATFDADGNIQNAGTVLTGETGQTLDTSSYGAGSYNAVVTNPSAPLLTLVSITFNV